MTRKRNDEERSKSKVSYPINFCLFRFFFHWPDDNTTTRPASIHFKNITTKANVNQLRRMDNQVDVECLFNLKTQPWKRLTLMTWIPIARKIRVACDGLKLVDRERKANNIFKTSSALRRNHKSITVHMKFSFSWMSFKVPVKNVNGRKLLVGSNTKKMSKKVLTDGESLTSHRFHSIPCLI